MSLYQREQVFNSLYENIFEVILERFGVEEENKKYIFSFFSFGLVAVIQTWIENDCKDEITKILNGAMRRIRNFGVQVDFKDEESKIILDSLQQAIIKIKEYNETIII